jgi:NitT/TauT family transport system substrate-binding protein
VGALLIGSSGVASAANDVVKLGVAPAYPTYAIFAAAKDLGFASAANLDVQIQSFRNVAAVRDALVAGAIDVGPVPPNLIAASLEKGAHVRIVAMYEPVRQAGWYIMVPVNSPVRTIADLNGKTVGVTAAGSNSDAWLQYIAKSAKIAVTSVPMTSGMAVGLRAKQADAAIMWPIASYETITSGEMRPIVGLENAVPPTIGEGIATTQDMIDKHPDVLKRWLDATSKTVAYMQTHEAWSLAFLKQYFNTTDDTTIQMIYNNVILKIHPDGAMHDDWKRESLTLGSTALPAEIALTQKAVFYTAPKAKKK